MRIALAVLAWLACTTLALADANSYGPPPNYLINVKAPPYNAQGDGRIVTPTITIGSGSASLSASASTFLPADVGKTIVIANAGVAPTTGPVMAQPVATAGLGYTSVPTCAFTDASSSGSGATCSALMTLQSATLVTGGATCTNGTFVFMAAIDGTGTAAQITGTVTGGVLAGSLTVSTPGLLTAFGTLTGASIYGANCATAPTVNLSYGVGAVQVTAQGSAYSTTQTTAALTGGSAGTAATLGTTAIGAPIPPLVTTISSYTSTTQVGLAATASTAITASATQLLIATNDGAAFQAAISAGAGIYIPPGLYWIGQVLDPGVKDLTVLGNGFNNTILAFDNGTSTSQDSGAWYPLFKNTSGSAPNWKGSLEFEDFQIRGLLDFGRVNVGAASTELNNYLELSFDRMKWYQIPWMAQQNESANRYRVENSVFDTIMRDQARCRSCFNAIVKGNTFRHSDDDSVALHQASYLNSPGQVREGIVVEGNTFEDTTCIAILGARQVVVSGNTLRRCKLHGVEILADSSEGIDQMRSIIVSNNIITDMLSRLPLSEGSTDIYVNAYPPSGVSGSTNFIPGANAKAGTAYFGRPWDFDLNNVVSGASLAGPARNIDIRGNSILRTLPASTSYASYGYGNILTNVGFYDSPTPDNIFSPNYGIESTANETSLNIDDNTVDDVTYGISMPDTISVPELSSVSITRNHLHNTVLGGIIGYGSGSLRDLKIIGNEIDVDPYGLSPGRSGVHGGWANSYGFSACLTLQFVTVVELVGNTFSNCYQINTSTRWTILANVVRGTPFSGLVGSLNVWNASNYGIGVYPLFTGNGFLLSNVAVDPTVTNPTNLGAINNNHLFQSSVAPTTGYHVAGDIIWSTAPTTCSCLGWQALTTGSSWTLGTDYIPIPLGGQFYTVATLPTGIKGMQQYITDQLTACPAAGVAPTGGGGGVVPLCSLIYNGVGWVGN